jgi:hypothetical protein
MLFDPTTAKGPEPKRHAESTYAFLNRAAGDDWERVRLLLEQWTRRIDPVAWRQTLSEFRNDDCLDGRSAFWELYLNEVFSRLGFDPLHHPALPNTAQTPDFLLRTRKSPLYVEAVAIDEPEDEKRAHRLLGKVYDYLNEHLQSSVYTLYCDPFKIGQAVPSPDFLAQLRADLSNWLTALDPDTLRPWTERYVDWSSRNDGCYLWRGEGWGVEFWAVAKPASRRGHFRDRIIGVYGWTQGREVDDHLRIRRALGRKAKMYGDGRRFVIALLSPRTTTKRIDRSLVRA